MDIFCHISEFGPQGLDNIPALAFVSNRLTLWAPAFGLIEDARRRQYSILGPEDVLTLVESRHLQIMGRRSWFTDPAHRASISLNYPLAAWVDKYDERLWELALEDEAELPEHRRVLIAPEADGQCWANRILESDDPVDRTRLDLVKRLLLSGRYPAGTREKLQQVDTEHEALKVLLADVRNHSKAAKDAEANRLALLSDEADFYAQALPNDPVNEEHAPTADDAFHLLELLKLLTSISRPRNAKQLKGLLEHPDRKQLLREAGRLLESNMPAHLALRHEVRRGLPTDRAKLAFLGTNAIDRSVTASGILAAMASFHFSIEAAPLFGLLQALAGPAVHGLREASLLNVPTYAGPALPFVLAYDRSKPTYKQIAALVERVEELLP